MSSSARSAQILLVTSTVLLTATLYLAPQFKSESHTINRPAVFSFNKYEQQLKSRLSTGSAAALNQLEKEAKEHPAEISLLDSLSVFWEKENRPGVAAHYLELKAKKDPSEQNWLSSAYRYFDAFQGEQDSSLHAYFANKAIIAYEKVVSLNPGNLDAKTDLGVCYALGTPQPMKGIMLLREVVEKNPNHENAQFNLGILSMRSGQYSKAVERFSKVLEINPKRTEMLFMIGRAYMMEGNKEQARKNFEKFKAGTSDVALLNETNDLLKQLNN